MLQLKPNVRLFGLRPEMLVALLVVKDAFGAHDTIITSGSDGTHSRGSEHYVGAALDFRLHHVPADQRAGVVQRIKDSLPADFDVLWEGAGTPNEHLHLEYDPQSPY